MNLYPLAALLVLASTGLCSAEHNDSQVLISSNEMEELKASQACPWGFQYIPAAGGCYTVVLESLNWHQSQARCPRLHSRAHLAIITNARQDAAVINYLTSFGKADTAPCRKNNGHISFYTSGQRINPNDCSTRFVWKPSFQHSIPLSYTNWYPGQPDCPPYSSAVQKQACLNYIEFGNSYKWNDIPCSWSGCAICQMDV